MSISNAYENTIQHVLALPADEKMIQSSLPDSSPQEFQQPIQQTVQQFNQLSIQSKQLSMQQSIQSSIQHPLSLSLSSTSSPSLPPSCNELALKNQDVPPMTSILGTNEVNKLLMLPPDIHNLVISYIPYSSKFKCRLISRRYNRLILPHLNTYFASNDIQLTNLLKSEMFPFIEKLHVDRLMIGHTQKFQILTAHTIIEVVSQLLKRKGKVEACVPFDSCMSANDDGDTSAIGTPCDVMSTMQSLNNIQNFVMDTRFPMSMDTNAHHSISMNTNSYHSINMETNSHLTISPSLNYGKNENPSDAFSVISEISDSSTEKISNFDASEDMLSDFELENEVNTIDATVSTGYSTGHSIPFTDDCTYYSGADYTMDSIDEEFCTNAFVTRDIQLTELHIKYFNLNYAGKMTRDRHDTMFLKTLFTLCGDEISQQVQKLTILTLDMSDEAIGKYIKRYSSSLKELSLWGNTYITNASVMHLVNSPLSSKLTRLELGAFGIMLTDCSLIAIAECMPQLEHLNLCRCSGLTDRSVGVMAKNLTNLKSLDLGFIPNITNTSISNIIDHLHLLETIRLRRCSITEAGMKDIHKLKNLKALVLSETLLTSIDFLRGVSCTLEHLELDRCEKLIHLDSLTSLVQLRHLSMSHYFKLDDAIVAHFAPQLNKLEFLEICCGRLTDASFIALSKLHNIRHLYLHYSCKITDAGFIALCNNLNRLESFTCSRCEKVSVDAITTLKQLKRLKMLDLTSGEVRKHMFDEKLTFFLKIPHVRL